MANQRLIPGEMASFIPAEHAQTWLAQCRRTIHQLVWLCRADGCRELEIVVGLDPQIEWLCRTAAELLREHARCCSACRESAALLGLGLAVNPRVRAALHQAVVNVIEGLP